MSWLRLEKFTFFVLLFSIPFQKRIFLFGPGLPQTAEFFEWGSAFLYFTDFLILLLFGFWIWGFRSKMKKGEVAENSTPPVAPPFAGGGFRGGMHVMLLLFLGFALISLTQAELMNVGAYRFLKLTEFVLLFFYIANRVPKIGVKPILAAFAASGAFQSVIAILQFMKQSSLGLEIFHESTLAIGMKGVAHIAADGVSLIRAYGTFPSPNVLAGFLGVCLLVLFCLFMSSGQKNQNLKRTGNYYNVRSYVMLICIFLLSLGLILTFSRGVIIFFACTSAVFFAGIFLAEKLQYYKKRAIQVAGFVLVSWSVILAAAWPEVSTRFLESSASEPAIQERLFFNKVGADMMSQNYSQLFFGVGIGNFVHHYMQSLPGLASHLYQPVHNMFILIASEIGIFGLFAFIIFMAFLIGKSLRVLGAVPYSHDRGNSVIVFSLFCVLCFLFLVSLYDHYFWTIQQGSLMFWVALGLLSGITNEYNKKP